jgi:hypothetical protein
MPQNDSYLLYFFSECCTPAQDFPITSHACVQDVARSEKAALAAKLLADAKKVRFYVSPEAQHALNMPDVCY